MRARIPNAYVQISNAHHELGPNIKVLCVPVFSQQHTASGKFIRITTGTMGARYENVTQLYVP